MTKTEERIKKIRRKAQELIRKVSQEDTIQLVRTLEESGDGCNYSDLPLEVQERIKNRTITPEEYIRYRFSAFFNPFWDKSVIELTEENYDRIRDFNHEEEGSIAHLPRYALENFLEGIKTYGDLRKKYYEDEIPTRKNQQVLRRRLKMIRGLGSKTGRSILSILERVGFFDQNY